MRFFFPALLQEAAGCGRPVWALSHWGVACAHLFAARSCTALGAGRACVCSHLFVPLSGRPVMGRSAVPSDSVGCGRAEVAHLRVGLWPCVLSQGTGTGTGTFPVWTGGASCPPPGHQLMLTRGEAVPMRQSTRPVPVSTTALLPSFSCRCFPRHGALPHWQPLGQRVQCGLSTRTAAGQL